MSVTIYHNPNCGTSRNTLAMIRNAGIEPVVIEYLKTPPGPHELMELVRRMGVPLRSVLRRKGTPFDELGLGDPAVDDAALLVAIEHHPILINRPIVVTRRGVALCRPSEVVLDLLDAPQRTDFVKEDGDPVVIADRLSAGELAELEVALIGAGLPAGDIRSHTGSFYRFAKPLGQTVGYGGLEGGGDDALLRSLIVLPAFRGQGFGKAIALALERIAATASVTTLHVLTMSAEGLFTKLGYRVEARASTPAEIAATAEFRDLCPASAIYLTKSVRTSW